MFLLTCLFLALSEEPEQLVVGNFSVTVGRKLGYMRVSDDLLKDPKQLRKRLEEDGYLYLKSVLPKSHALAAQSRLVEELLSLGFLDTSDPSALLADPSVLEGLAAGGDKGELKPSDSDWKPRPGLELDARKLLQTPEIKAATESSALFAFFELLFGEPATTYDFKWFRPVLPGQFTGFHMDRVYMGNGSERVLTTWLPLSLIPPDVGGIAVLEGSHRLPGFERIRETYGRYDVDMGDIRGMAHFTTDPNELLQYGGRFVTSPLFEPGDIVVFPLTTFHGSVKNTHASRVRLSTDVRFQPAAEPVDPRWKGEPETLGATRFDPSDGKSFTKSMDEAKCEWGVPSPSFECNKVDVKEEL